LSGTVKNVTLFMFTPRLVSVLTALDCTEELVTPMYIRPPTSVTRLEMLPRMLV
jgi:hypothetical protein